MKSSIFFLAFIAILLCICLFSALVYAVIKRQQHKHNIIVHKKDWKKIKIQKQLRFEEQPVLRKIEQMDIVVFIFLSILAFFALCFIEKYNPTTSFLLFVLLGVGVLLNQLLIKHLWRCPHCNEKLPIQWKWRSGLEPRIVEFCPHCEARIFSRNLME